MREHDNLTLVFELRQIYPVPTATDMSTLTKKMPAFIKLVKNAKYVREKCFVCRGIPTSTLNR